MNAAIALIDADIAAAALELAVARTADRIVALDNAVAVVYRHHGPRGVTRHLKVFLRATDCDGVAIEGCQVNKHDVRTDAATIETARALLAA